MLWSEVRRQVLRTGLGLGTAGLLASVAGCGFALRRPPKLAFGSIAMSGFAPRSPLAEELQAQLAQQVRVLPPPATVDVVLQSLVDVRERSVVASTSAAQVRALQLRVKFTFRAQTPGGRELIPRAELLLARDMSYTENAALAKEYEEGELFRAMQSDIVLQVLRRLAAVQV